MLWLDCWDWLEDWAAELSWLEADEAFLLELLSCFLLEELEAFEVDEAEDGLVSVSGCWSLLELLSLGAEDF